MAAVLIEGYFQVVAEVGVFGVRAGAVLLVAAGIDGEVADAVAGRGGDGVVAVGHEMQGAVANEERVVAAYQSAEGRAETDAVRGVGAVVIHLLLEEILGHVLVIVRWIRGPASVGDGDLGEPEAFVGTVGVDEVAVVALGIAFAPCAGGHLVGGDGVGLAGRRAGAGAEGEFDGGVRGDDDLGTAAGVGAGGQAVEDAGAAAEVGEFGVVDADRGGAGQKVEAV